MGKKAIVLFFVVLFIGFFNLSAEEKETPLLGWGFIFNTNNILLDIDSYQAGIGIKVLKKNNVALRFLGDLFYSNSVNSTSVTIGVTYEKHLNPGRVSPYWGGYIEAGFLGQKSEIDQDNWTRNTVFPLETGGILGVEFFIMDFLSIFAEYSLSLDTSISLYATSIAGDITRTNPEFNYSIDLGIGNSSSIGLVIYLDDVVTLKKKAE